MNTSIHHWPEYLIEGTLLGLFMISACTFTILLEHPVSPVHRAIRDPFERRSLIGLAMGLTAIALIYSPMGRRSGAHMNPSLTLTFGASAKSKSATRYSMLPRSSRAECWVCSWCGPWQGCSPAIRPFSLR